MTDDSRYEKVTYLVTLRCICGPVEITAEA
jgi:hypothetical protein